jgi:hypothetical protein
LKLEVAGPKGDTQERGEITVRFWTQETAKASAAAVADARQAVQEKLEGGNTAAKSLEAVVSKLKAFAAIADEAAQVLYSPFCRDSELTCLIVQIHPYVNLVWQTISSVYKVRNMVTFPLYIIDHRYVQVVKNQLDRDQKLIDLMTSMENVYSFVDEIESLRDKNNTLDKIIKLILQQTFECAIFIQEYAGRGFASA